MDPVSPSPSLASISSHRQFPCGGKTTAQLQVQVRGKVGISVLESKRKSSGILGSDWPISGDGDHWLANVEVLFWVSISEAGVCALPEAWGLRMG